MNDHDEQVRQAAYRIWQEAGEPEGEDEAHWHQAEREIAGQASGETTTSEGAAPAEDTAAAPADVPLPPDESALTDPETVLTSQDSTAAAAPAPEAPTKGGARKRKR